MSDGPSILIIEDDEAIAQGLALNMKLAGFRASVATDGDAALEAIERQMPDLILLDVLLPKRNGLDVLDTLRKAGSTTPVIVLSARQAEFDKVAALRLGADDYVTKPFGVAELLARIDAVLRRAGISSPGAPTAVPTPGANVLRFADVEIDPEARTVSRRGKALSLTHLEFELLAFLTRNAGKVFGREVLLRQVWGVSHSGSARTVDNFVAQLRAKLEPDPNRPQHLVTVRGSGYRFDP